MIGLLGKQCRQHTRSVAGVLVDADKGARSCSICGRSMRVQKTWERTAMTLAHGCFRIRQTVYVCPSGCRRGGRLVRGKSPLADLIPPRGVVGYDVMVHVGLQRFLHHRQREEIRAALEAEHGIILSSGEISGLSARFLAYLERLHHASAPGLRAALASDGGWPLHVDASGEDGRGTLLVAFAGWRQWVLGAWKVPTERAEAILPRLREVVFRFGPPCAIMRDLGRAMAEASQSLVKQLKLPIPVLACHLHFLSDIGKDLLQDAHDRLRALFRQTRLRSRLRTHARDLGRCLGENIPAARAALRQWQAETAKGHRIPAGPAGIAIVRGLAQWVLDYPVDGSGQGFPFDLPWLGLYDRCLQASSAVEAFLENPPDDPKVRRELDRLRRILQPIECDPHGFGPLAETLTIRAKLFNELREALRLTEKQRQTDATRAATDLRDVRFAVKKLTRSLRQRRSVCSREKDKRRAIDIILSHLKSHGDFLWGHAIRIAPRCGGLRLVDRTNNILESYFRRLKHGERRRSGRKILSQDFEHLSPAAPLTANLAHADYVAIVCGSLDRLPEAFARLDARNRHASQSAAVLSSARTACPETASLSTADRRTIRTQEMTSRVIAAAQSRFRKRKAA